LKAHRLCVSLNSRRERNKEEEGHCLNVPFGVGRNLICSVGLMTCFTVLSVFVLHSNPLTPSLMAGLRAVQQELGARDGLGRALGVGRRRHQVPPPQAAQRTNNPIPYLKRWSHWHVSLGNSLRVRILRSRVRKEFHPPGVGRAWGLRPLKPPLVRRWVHRCRVYNQLLHRNVQRFRGGLVFKAHRLESPAEEEEEYS